MKKDERVIYFYDFLVKSSARNFPSPATISARNFFKLIELIPINKRTRSILHGREYYYVSDWKSSGEYLTVLINKSDKGISDPVFSNPELRNRRTVAKGGDEGQDFSVHVVIKFPKNDLDPALVLVEKCAGLGVYQISKLFDGLIREVKKIYPDKFKVKHPDGSVLKNGKPNMISVSYHSNFEGHVSKQIVQDLEAGVIQNIELVTERNKNNRFDTQGYLTESTSVLNVSVKDDGTWSQKFKVITQSIKRRSNDYEKARVRYKDKSGASGYIDIETDSGVVEGYTKKERIASQTELKSSYDTICDDIAVRMKRLM
jgi:hypothetical protein